MTKTKFSATTAELSQALGMGVKSLKTLRQLGVFVAGKHFRYTGAGAVRPRLRWCIEACEEAITQRSRRLEAKRG